MLLNYGDRALSEHSVRLTWAKLRNRVLSLPFSEEPIEIANCDARAFPCRQAETVVTSPPYINVFNYHQQYRCSAEAMGWDLLEVAKSEIGSNRKNRGNRYLTVIQYCLDMAAVLRMLRKSCKPNARIIIVLGRESNVRKTRFYNGEIIAKLAVNCAGLKLESRQERVFRNRFGDLIYEDILHLIQKPMTVLCAPSEIARENHVGRSVTALSRRFYARPDDGAGKA